MPPTFLSLCEASRRSGLSAGHLARQCRAAWAASGLAEIRTPDDGGKPAWFVREDAAPELARVKSPEQLPADLGAVSRRQRERALWKRSILQRWKQSIDAAFTLGFDRDAATGRFLQQMFLAGEGEISRRTLYRWDCDFRSAGLDGLVDGRAARAADRRKDENEDPFLAEVQRLWLSLRKPRLSACHEITRMEAAKQGWPIRTYKACQRHVAKIPKAVVLKRRGGDEAYVNHAEPFIECDYSTLESNELWCSDHHQFDVLVKIQERLDARSGEMIGRHVRPWLTAFQDVRSRKIVGWEISAADPNSDRILSVFRRSVIEHGVPRKLLIDNGRDYDCYDLNGRTKRDRWRRRKIRVGLAPHAAGIFPSLGIEIHHAQPYHGQSKPIERWFGFLESRTFVFATYCGNSPGNKPEDLQLQLERGEAPTLQELSGWFDQFVAAYNAGHSHSGDSMDGKTPDQVYAEHLHTKITAPAELLDLLCLRRIDRAGGKDAHGNPRLVKIGQNGVTYRGLRYGQHEPALLERLGEAVILRVDDRDLSRIQVFDSQDRFICIAPANAKVPRNADAGMVRRAIVEKKKHLELQKNYRRERMRLHEELPERLIRAMAQKRAIAAAENEPTPPDQSGRGPNLRPLRHPLEAQLDAIRSAAAERGRLKIAVGAESLSAPRGGEVSSISFAELMRQRLAQGDGSVDDE